MAKKAIRVKTGVKVVKKSNAPVIDTQFDIIPDGFIALIIFASIWTIGIITTLILAINHFKRVQKAKREKKEINDNLLKPK